MTLAVEPLVVYGPRKADAHGTRADALVALKALVDPKKKPSLHSGQLEVVPSPGGHSAWVFDIVEVGGASLAITAVLSNADDIWQVSAAQLAETPAMRTVRAELKKDAVVPPGMASIAKVADSARPAVDKLEKGLAAQQQWGDELGARSDAVVIGPGSGDITRGKAEIKKLFKKRVKANVRATAAGEVTAATTADGQLAWVTLPVVQFEDDTDPLPLRLFAVYEKNGSDWKMIALQESLAVDAAGAGAAFKKVAAPAIPKPEEPPPPKKDDAKKKPTTTKKKKKKKKSSDDE
jgi:SnoaL-like protein